MFNYSSRERRGIVFLMLLIVLVNTGSFLYTRFSPRPSAPPEVELKYIASWEVSLDRSLKHAPKRKKSRHVMPEAAFNPNEYSVEDWQKLGFSEKQASSIWRIGTKRPFKTKEDVKKLFCMPPDFYEILKDSLIFPEKYSAEKSNPKPEQPVLAETLPLDINSADSLEILKLPGIGPYWTMRILKARSLWGGFCCIEQIANLKGMTDSVLTKFSNRIYINKEHIQKFNINTISKEDFSKHPAGWYGVANSVVNYRNQHGSFHSADDLRKIVSLKSEKLEILRHYVIYK